MQIFLSNIVFVTMASWAVITLVVALVTMLKIKMSPLTLHDGIRLGAMARQMLWCSATFAFVAMAAIVWQVFFNGMSAAPGIVLVGLGAFVGTIITPMIAVVVDFFVTGANKQWEQSHSVRIHSNGGTVTSFL